MDVYKKLLELVILQQENLGEKIVRVQDYLTQISCDVIEIFFMMLGDQEEDDDVCCLTSRVSDVTSGGLSYEHHCHDNCSRRMFKTATSSVQTSVHESNFVYSNILYCLSSPYVELERLFHINYLQF